MDGDIAAVEGLSAASMPGHPRCRVECRKMASDPRGKALRVRGQWVLPYDNQDMAQGGVPGIRHSHTRGD